MSVKKASADTLPGSYEERVYIGGNYDFLSKLRQIKKFVEKAGFVPILAYDFCMPEGETHDYCLRLVHNCKYAIFEETSPAGELVEVERATRDYEKVVFIVYEIRSLQDKGPPAQIPKMLTSLRLPMFGYSTIEELERFINNIFTAIRQKPNLPWSKVVRIAWLPTEERAEIIRTLRIIDNVFMRRLSMETKPPIPLTQRHEGLALKPGQIKAFHQGAQLLTRFQSAFKTQKIDLKLESKGFVQECLVDFSELYRFLHPEHIKTKALENLIVTRLMFSKPSLLNADLYLIPPYLAELLMHLRGMSRTLGDTSLKQLLRQPAIKEFVKLMSRKDWDRQTSERLRVLSSYIKEYFLDLLNPKTREVTLEKRFDQFFRLISENTLRIWTEPEIPISDLVKSPIYKGSFEMLCRFPLRRFVSNKIDALAAAFVHEANKTSFDRKRFSVLLTGSPIPLLVYRSYPCRLSGMTIPIARNLYYVASRLYIFNKFDDMKIRQSFLQRILENTKPILEAVRLIDLHGWKFEKVPPDLRQTIKEATPSFRNFYDRLAMDMPEVLAKLVYDTFRDQHTIDAVELIDYDPALFLDVYETFNDEQRFKECIQGALMSITKIIEKLEKLVGKLEWDKIHSLIRESEEE